MTDTSDKAIEALAAAPWAYASADLSAMLLALQAERNKAAALCDDYTLMDVINDPHGAHRNMIRARDILTTPTEAKP